MSEIALLFQNYSLICQLQYEVQNVKEMWNVSNKILKFDVSWKHIVVGFYHKMNEQTIIFNNLISFLALRIYKYTIWCRIEE